MVKQAQTLNLRRWSTRTHTRVGLPVVIAVLFSIAIVQSWASTTGDLATTRTEQRGVAYLKPLTELMDRMITAQSVAVRGSGVDTAGLRDAMSKVDQVNHTHGKALASSQRWNDVRSRIEYLITLRPTAEAAYRAYTDVVQLVGDLIRKIADTSNLILDPQMDTYYLMDTAVLRLPNVLLFTGRAADLGSLGAKAGADSKTQTESETRVSVARYQVSADSDEIASGLRKALDITESTTLGPSITNQLDTFRTAVDAFVPPVNLLQNLEPVDAATVTANGERVREAARKLSTAVLTELDKLLSARSSDQSVARTQSLGVGTLCLILLGLLVWMLVTRFGEAERTGRERSGAELDSKQGPVDWPVEDGYEQRQAQATEELVHVGRSIRPRRRERADDAR